MRSSAPLWKVAGLIVGLLVIVRDVVFATEYLVRRSGPYMTRFYLLGWPARLLSKTGLTPNLYLQHFHQSDHKIPHNHPRWFLSLILRGGYLETVWRGRPVPGKVLVDKFVRLPWRLNRIPTTRYHYVELLNKSRGCWTLCLVGPTCGRGWGFWYGGKYVDSKTYKRRVLGLGGTKPQPVVGARSTDH